MTQCSRVLLVDDHSMICTGLKALIRRSGRCAVVGEAGTYKEAIRLVTLLRPCLVMMDISLGKDNGLDLSREVIAIAPETGILMYTMHTDMDMVAQAFRSGVRGYVTKTSSVEKVLLALDAVSQGKRYVDSNLSGGLIDKLNDVHVKDTDKRGLHEPLTPRELEVLRHVADGMSSKDISEHLFISPKTVENHRTSIMSKLGLSNAVDMTRYAIRHGLSSLDD